MAPVESLLAALPDELLSQILERAFSKPPDEATKWEKGSGKLVCRRWKLLLPSPPSGTSMGVGVICAKDGAFMEVYTAAGELVRSLAIDSPNGARMREIRGQLPAYENRWPAAVSSSGDVILISDHACENVQVYRAANLQYQKKGSIKCLIQPEGTCLLEGILYILHSQKGCSVCSAIDPQNRSPTKPFVAQVFFPKGYQAWGLCAGPDRHLYTTTCKNMVGEYPSGLMLSKTAVKKIGVKSTAGGVRLHRPVKFAGATRNEQLKDAEPNGDPEQLLGCNGLAFGPTR